MFDAPVIDPVQRDIVDDMLTQWEGRDIAESLSTVEVVASVIGLDGLASMLDDARREIKQLRTEVGTLKHQLRDAQQGRGL